MSIEIIWKFIKNPEFSKYNIFSKIEKCLKYFKSLESVHMLENIPEFEKIELKSRL